jgi:predicted lipoprotein
MARWRRAGLAALATVALLAVLRPWTVLPIAPKVRDRFDAVAYADSVWPRVLEEAAAATDVAAVLREHGPRSGADEGSPAKTPLFIRGSGVATGVDVASRVGRVRLRLDGLPTVELDIQVGPVLRGTVLRDALDFVRFSDFANQSEFAAVANALNDKVLRSVLGKIDPQVVAGKRLSFVGATEFPGPRGTRWELVPVRLEALESK